MHLLAEEMETGEDGEIVVGFRVRNAQDTTDKEASEKGKALDYLALRPTSERKTLVRRDLGKNVLCCEGVCFYRVLLKIPVTRDYLALRAQAQCLDRGP